MYDSSLPLSCRAPTRFGPDELLGVQGRPLVRILAVAQHFFQVERQVEPWPESPRPCAGLVAANQRAIPASYCAVWA